MVLNDVKGRILDGGMSERNGNAIIEMYAGTAAETPIEVEDPVKWTVE